MVSHYSDMGFIVKNFDDIKRICEKNKDKVIVIKNNKYFYNFFSIDKYIEFWMQVDKKNQVLGLEFHYDGKGLNKLQYINWVALNKNEQAGILRCGYNEMPINLNIPETERMKKLKQGQICTFQIAGFAEDINFYKTELDYMNSQVGEFKYASQFFIPSGTFSPNNAKEFKQNSNAIFAGKILDFEKRFNSYSSLGYYWFLVESYGLTLDVVADSECVPENIAVGHIISGNFWLSAKFIGIEISEEFSLLKFKHRLELISSMLIETGGKESIVNQIIFSDIEFAKQYVGNKSDLIKIIDDIYKANNVTENAQWKFLDKMLFILDSIKIGIEKF